MRVVITKNAKLELIEIVDYISTRSSSNTGRKIYSEIKEKIKVLRSFPESGRIIPELEDVNILDYKEIIASPWRIIYEIKRGKLYILTIIDGRRNIEDILLKKFLR